MKEKLLHGFGVGRQDSPVTHVDSEGYPVREEGSTRYVGAIETSEAFGDRIDDEAIRRGLRVAQNMVVLADGARFRAQGLFVGSGVIEAGCKTIVGMRLKQSGMEWTVRGANAIIALQRCYLSSRMEAFWEQRVA